MYQEGLGVPRDYVAAQAWFERSAAQNDPVRPGQLGCLLLQNGLGHAGRL